MKAENGKHERNIMILFLSEIKLENVSNAVQKLNPEYAACYTFHDGTEDTQKCALTNEAPLRDVAEHLRRQGKTLDKIFCFRTEALKEGPIKLLEEDEVRSYQTKEELFQKRIRRLCAPSLDHTEFVDVEFDTGSAHPVQECIKAVAAMEKKIKEYIPQEEFGDCHLFADITGGFRTASMVMTAVMQLLQYDGINMDLVLYSDWISHTVTDVRDINNLYKLVAGVDAFVKYGSATALNEYFADVKETYEPLRVLLDAMNDFSESVLLCQPKAIKEHLEKLMEALEAFPPEADENGPRPQKAEFFARMLDDLKSKYMPMYPEAKAGEPREIDRIAVIRWCVENNMIQQAITFCTEWLPDYLIDHGAIYTNDIALQRYLDDKSNEPKKYFMMKFLTDKTLPVDEIYEKPLQKALRLLLQKEISADEAKEFLPEKFVETMARFLDRIDQDLSAMRNGETVENKILQKIVDRLISPSDGSKRMNLENIRRKHIISKLDRWISDLDTWYRNELFALPPNTKRDSYRALDVPYITDDQCGNAARRAAAMLHCGILGTDLNAADGKGAVYYIEEYTYIRAHLRNKFNHVDTADYSKIKEPVCIATIKDYMLGYLDALDKLKDKPKPHFAGLWA